MKSQYVNKITDFFVVDGNTVEATLDLPNHARMAVTVCLAGIDCANPRSKDRAVRLTAEEAANEAFKWLSLHEKGLRLHSEKLERSRLTTGHIRNAAGESLSDHLLSLGLAKPYTEK